MIIKMIMVLLSNVSKNIIYMLIWRSEEFMRLLYGKKGLVGLGVYVIWWLLFLLMEILFIWLILLI